MSLHRTHRGLALAMAIVITAPLLAVGSARAVADPVSIASLPIVPCGSTATSVLPVSSSVTDDGWTVLDYNINGVVNQQYIPPVGFDPSTMSDQDVQRHHLPARPVQSTDEQDWASNLRLLAGSHNRNLCVGHGLKMGVQRYAINWGGDEVRYQSSYRFDGVQGYFTQSALGTGCGTSSDLGQWVGIGGDDATTNDYPFFQAGTSAMGPALDTPGYYSFYEYFAVDIIPDPDPVYMYGLTVSPGDAMYSEVDWVASGSMASFYVSDSNPNHPWAWLTSVTDPELWLGRSAEWIDERMLGDPSKVSLTPYGWTSWTQLKTHHTNSAPSTWTPAYNEPTEWWVMMTSDGNPLSSHNRELSQTTGTYSDSHMQDHWHACK
jgi:hypothetical protein